MTRADVQEKVRKIWKTGEHMTNEHEFVEHMMDLIDSWTAEIIGDYEDDKRLIWKDEFRRQSSRNVLREEQRQKAGLPEKT